MKSLAQILDQVPIAARCDDADDVEFAIWKLKKLSNESGLVISESPKLAKRLSTLEAKANKFKQ